MVAVNLWYHVGPANEAAGRTGFAHLFEHMMFQGSKHVPDDSHFQLLEAAGASDINGTTDFDRTNYFETVPAESARAGALARVRSHGLSARQARSGGARRTSRTSCATSGGRAIENQPYGIAEEALVQMLFPKGHPYYANVIGSHEDIQAAKLEDVKEFFKQYYAPNNASLAIVGDFDPGRRRRRSSRSTSARSSAAPRCRRSTCRRRRSRRSGARSCRIASSCRASTWRGSRRRSSSRATPRRTSPATILGGGRSSRLYKKLVYEKQIAQNVSAYQQSLMLGSLFQIEATARPGHTAEELEKAIDEELEALRAKPVEQREIERARNTIETQTIGRLESLFGGVANRLNMYNHYLEARPTTCRRTSSATAP